MCGERRQAAEINLADVAGGFDIVALVVRDQACYIVDLFATFPALCLRVCIIHLPFVGTHRSFTLLESLDIRRWSGNLWVVPDHKLNQ